LIKITNKLGQTRIYLKKYKRKIFPKEKFETKKFYLTKRKPLYCGGLRFRGFFKDNIKDKPLISIIMPNFKCADLENAIKSILKQNYENLELIVIDGSSGKDTVKILKTYDQDIDIWISEKDNGMWDAWNKGFQLASGEYVGIVDSSNILYPNAIKTLIKYAYLFPKKDFICGTVRKDNRIYAGFRPKDIVRQFNIIPSSVVGFFIKLKSLKKVGLLDTRYKIQADYDLLYKIIIKNNMSGVNTKGNEIFGDLGNSGFSSRHNFLSKLINEIIIRFRNGQNIFYLIYIIFGRSFMKILKLIIKKKNYK
jgi:glycosyltransferase involved in cell wall biosynthesis|tara:strand:+ start:35 stop:958 length:924 start_codon:yes stop_codon:yes gene_type:complete